MFWIPTNPIALISLDSDPASLMGHEQVRGQNVYVHQVGLALAKIGWQVDIFTCGTSPSQAAITEHSPNCRTIRLETETLGLTHFDSLFNLMPELVTEFQAFEREQGFQYSLVHTNDWLSSWVGMELKKRQPLIQVHTYHCLETLKNRSVTNIPETWPTRLAIEKAALETVDRLVSTNPQQEEHLRRLVSSFGKIDLIPCGTDLNRFGAVSRTSARHQLGIVPDAKVIIYVGPFDPRKGVDILVEAIAHSRFREEEIKLIIISGSNTAKNQGIERDKLENLLKKSGLSDCTEFPGRLDQTLPLYYAAADLCVIPTQDEPFGLVALEAMASRTPVVASFEGALQFSVIPEVTGLLVKPLDPLGFTKAIDRILSHPQWRDQLGQAGRLRTEMAFSWDGVASRLSKLYSHLLTQPRTKYRQLSPVAA
ncbi:glycosyltransferase [Gloeothece verrucosa]|uniref:Glycosyl transferase group 1 n=1 Tax=Gloeothece verrucosa (strain PCC 7822) TaxID=497965 RepID=E0UBI9_GLOV7|nr:glycosyltransferase [Gloeothece verrucosa]ADN12821.1 glycosyl transferase group 1 [Gloeothece verrucosa PCC 7822]